MWQVLITPELSIFDMSWLAGFSDSALQLICGLGVAMTLAFEISFMFLIWNRRLRPLLLVTALVFHGFIGVLMGLGAFSIVMLSGCIAFVRPDSVQWLLQQASTLSARYRLVTAVKAIVD